MLVYGGYRCAAFRKLGRKTIPAMLLDLDDPRLELAEIDENLQRNSLTALEKMEALARRQRIYEELHPETKAGQSQAAGSNRAQGKGKDVSANLSPTFSEDTAAKMGQSPRSIQRKLAIYRKLDPEAVTLIKSVPKVADNLSGLIALAEQSAEKQREIAAKIHTGDIGSVREALQQQPEPAEDEPVEGEAAEHEAAEEEAAEDLDKIDDFDDRVDSAEDEHLDGLDEEPSGSDKSGSQSTELPPVPREQADPSQKSPLADEPPAEIPTKLAPGPALPKANHDVPHAGDDEPDTAGNVDPPAGDEGLDPQEVSTETFPPGNQPLQSKCRWPRHLRRPRRQSQPSPCLFELAVHKIQSSQMADVLRVDSVHLDGLAKQVQRFGKRRFGMDRYPKTCLGQRL
jgi:ParB-like chromosome segregation protein Spo0J